MGLIEESMLNPDRPSMKGHDERYRLGHRHPLSRPCFTAISRYLTPGFRGRDSDAQGGL